MERVILKKPALITIVISSIEVYKKETFGILIGRKRGEDFIVDYAINFQSAERHYEYVDINKLRERRIAEAIRYLIGKRYLGDFHSHTDGMVRLSRTDKKDIKDVGVQISLLITVRKTKKHQNWKYSGKDKSISGTIADKYIVKMIAYRFDRKTGKIDRLPIRCPYIKEINEINKLYEEIKRKIKKLEKDHKHEELESKLKNMLLSNF